MAGVMRLSGAPRSMKIASARKSLILRAQTRYFHGSYQSNVARRPPKQSQSRTAWSELECESKRWGNGQRTVEDKRKPLRYGVKVVVAEEAHVAVIGGVNQFGGKRQLAAFDVED